MRSTLSQAGFSNVQIFKYLNHSIFFWLFLMGICMESSEAAVTSYPVGVGPYDVTAGHFAGNAFDDIAVTSSDSLGLTDLTIFLDNGQGQFTQTQQFTIALKGTMAKVTTGFFNGDGAVDLAVLTNPGSFSSGRNLFIFANNSDGTFSQQGSFTFGSEQTGIVNGSFVGGGSQRDLALISFNQQTLTILLGDGMGNFTALPPIALSGHPTAITAGIIFNPAFDDIVVTYGDTNQVQVFKNNGLGLFTPAGTYSVGKFPTDVVLIDLDGDGSQDLAVANGKDNSVSVLLNRGNGTFRQAVNYAVEDAPTSLTFGLFSNSGSFDLAVANQARSTVSILVNNGDGTFKPEIPVVTGSGPVAISLVLLEGEVSALATADLTGGTVSVILNPLATLAASYSPVPSPRMREFLKFQQLAAHPAHLNLMPGKIASTHLSSSTKLAAMDASNKNQF